ncbi:hypothetical protein EDB80DRAFT_765940 [Ilyonectria destructans]|nr:hypothetical protein EDB80DRAFT_765940 [Ilyonectria destructans]
MYSFEYVGSPHRVTFGSGTMATLPAALEKMNARTALIVCTPEQVSLAEEVKKIIGSMAAAIFSEATVHTPTHITEKAFIVSVGGGSTISLGKALSIRTNLPHLCIPTTYAGSEMTPILGETEGRRKVTRRDPKTLPTSVIYDVDLLKTLPVGLTVYIGINPIAHTVEALYASNTNPIIELLACDRIRSLCTALPTLHKELQNPEARYKALYGVWLCVICLGSVEMALHRKLCHTLDGTFNLPHAETHGMIALYRRLGLTLSLKGFGMPEEGIDEGASVALSNPYKNPRALEHTVIWELIRRAWAGEPATRMDS